MKIYDKEKTLEYISELMNSKGLNNVDMAEIIHVSNSTICRKLKGERIFSLDELLLICEYFNITINELIQYREVGD